jgi:A/G-specific adenine glycosylase
VKSKFASKLLRWYGSRRRSLPWRERPRPYAVWVAEIMAQQTRLETMLPYFRRWLRTFPNIKSLGNASERQVLALWEGLGYYSRARNLRKAAQVVMAKHGGRLPADWDALRALPGIGDYTAGAIASLAFGLDKAAVDGNAMRVLARVFNVAQPADTSAGRARLCQLATEHLPAGRAADYNQALMDLGARVCTPRAPKCASCPLAAICDARRLGIQEQRPVKSKDQAAPLRKFSAAVIWQAGKVLVLQRPARGLLAGMWEFPNIQASGKAGLRRMLGKDLGLDLTIGQRLGTYDHAYSHFRARLQVFEIRMNGTRPAIKTKRKLAWKSPGALSSLPMGKLDRTVADGLNRK